MPQLPTPVQNQGITIRKRTPDILMVVSMYSKDDRYDDLYLSNFAMINIRDELLRVDGVSDVNSSASATTASASGSIPRRWRPMALTPATWPTRSDGRTSTCPPAGSASRRRRRTAVRRADRRAGPAFHSRAIRRHHRQGRPGRPFRAASAAGAARRGAGLPGSGMTNPLLGSTAIGRGLTLPTALGVLRSRARQAAANATTNPGPSSGLIGGVNTAGGASTGGGGGTGGGGHRRRGDHRRRDLRRRTVGHRRRQLGQ